MHKSVLLMCMLLNLLTKSAGQETRQENNNPQVYAIDSGVRHRPSKKSREDSLFTKNNKKGQKKYIGIFTLVLEGNCKRQNLFWLMMRMIICPLNVHYHVAKMAKMAKNGLLKITWRLFCFLLWL